MRGRAAWAWGESLDLEPLDRKIQAFDGGTGRDAVPRILLVLWLLATIERISSARHLGRLRSRDRPYLWTGGEGGHP